MVFFILMVDLNAYIAFLNFDSEARMWFRVESVDVSEKPRYFAELT